MSEPIKKILKVVGILVLVLLALFLATNLFGSLNRSSNQSQDTMMLSTGMTNSLSSPWAPATDSAGRMLKAEESASAPYAVTTNSDSDQAVANLDKKIIKTGNLNLKVDEAEAAASQITVIVNNYQGEITNSSFTESGRGTKSGTMTVRVPFAKFDSAFSEIKKVATQVISEASNAQDITEEYIDLAARLNNKRAEEQSFIALLNHWGNVQDVLSVTREIARVRGEIEQLEGRQRFLNSQTDMSTLAVYLSEDETIAPASQYWRPLQVLKASARQFIINGQNFVDGLIRFVVVVLPLLLIYVLIIWLVYYLSKKIFRRFKKPTL